MSIRTPLSRGVALVAITLAGLSLTACGKDDAPAKPVKTSTPAASSSAKPTTTSAKPSASETAPDAAGGQEPANSNTGNSNAGGNAPAPVAPAPQPAPAGDAAPAPAAPVGEAPAPNNGGIPSREGVPPVIGDDETATPEAPAPEDKPEDKPADKPAETPAPPAEQGEKPAQ
ncbi:hypothetical protein WG936_11435 [Corynebacterium sp. H127]|uniref:hypothetical protein n=1 Tax=Corynebacterium sp. H127 TaxID=3133418 RepID=UPI0030B2D307